MDTLWPEPGKTKAAERSILVTGSSLEAGRGTSLVAAWLTFPWWASSLASRPPAQTAQRTSSYKTDFVSLLHQGQLMNRPLIRSCSFLSRQVMLLQSISHMEHVGRKTLTLLLCLLYFDFTVRSWGNLLFFFSTSTIFFNNIFSPPHKCQVKEGHENKLEKEHYHDRTLIYSTIICGVVVIKLFGTIVINTIKANGLTFQSVDQTATLVDTCLSNHCLCVCKYKVFNHCHVPVITTMT